MTLTHHGHHIPNSPTNDEELGDGQTVARCGGPGLCSECTRSAQLWANQHEGQKLHFQDDKHAGFTMCNISASNFGVVLTVDWIKVTCAACADEMDLRKVRPKPQAMPDPFAAETKKVEVDLVNHPPHYTAYKGIEVIQLTEQMNFCRGNAVKYIARAGLKDPSLEKEIEDLKKAAWYIQREIERLENNADSDGVPDGGSGDSGGTSPAGADIPDSGASADLATVVSEEAASEARDGAAEIQSAKRLVRGLNTQRDSIEYGAVENHSGVNVQVNLPREGRAFQEEFARIHREADSVFTHDR